MTIAEQLFVAILKFKDSRYLSGIMKEWLDLKELRQFRYISDYYKDSGDLIGVSTFCSKFGLSEDVDSMPKAYFDQLRERYIYAKLSESIPSILKDAKDSPTLKLENLQNLVKELNVKTRNIGGDSLYSDSTSDRLERYEERTRCSGVTYLSMGLPELDKILYGYSKTDVITIAGASGQGKTWLLCYLVYILDLFLQKTEEDFGDILFISNEMSTEELQDRMDCIAYKLPYGKFLSGALDEEEYDRYEIGLRKLKKSGSRVRFIESCSTIDELSTLMGIHNPSIVFIDGSYLMEPKLTEGWEKITYVTRNFKRLVKTFNTPIVNTTQLKRGAGHRASKGSSGQEDFAYSTSFIQDSDIAIRMYQDADMVYHNQVGMEIVKGRRIKGGTTLMFKNDLDKMDLNITNFEKVEAPTELETITY